MPYVISLQAVRESRPVQSSQLSNFADKDGKVDFTDCTGRLRLSDEQGYESLQFRCSCAGRCPLNPLAELRRLYSIGLGAVAVTLPLLAVSIDTIQAAPK